MMISGGGGGNTLAIANGHDALLLAEGNLFARLTLDTRGPYA